MHVCGQNYATDLAQFKYSCELLLIHVCAAEITGYWISTKIVFIDE